MTALTNRRMLPSILHPGLSEIPAPDGPQQVMGHAHDWPVLIDLEYCLGAWMGTQASAGSCTQAFENVGPILHPAIVKRYNPLFVT